MSEWYKRGSGGMLLPLPKNGGVRMGRFFFWAEHGEVNMVDNDSGKHSAFAPRVAQMKLNRIAAGIGTSTKPGTARDSQERQHMLSAMQKIDELIQQARIQGEGMPELYPGQFS